MSSQSHQYLSQSWSVGSTPLNSVASRKDQSRSSSIPSARRIRFAPLPDPRALEDEAAAAAAEDGDGYETLVDPQVTGSDTGCSSVSSSLFSSPRIFTKDLLSPTEGTVPCDPSLNGSQATLADPYGPDDMTPTGSHSGASSPTTHKKAASWTAKPKKLFKPFLRRSSSPMAPPSSFGSGITTEDILTLGTINLFRSTSRESRMSTESLPTTPLNRWTSAGSYTGQKNKGKEWLGSPLSRTESTGSIKADTRGRPVRAPPAKSSTTPQANGKGRLRGTRMLNGRVYGGRGLNAQQNLFQTAKDTEPEFVEWGYGGMGSVKAGQNGDKQWSKLQSTGTSVGGGGGDDDDDDGGGMAWARKRKEARERAKQEAEERAKAEAEAKENGQTEQTEETRVAGQGVAPTEGGAEPGLSAVQEEPAVSPPAVEEVPVVKEQPSTPATELVSSPIEEAIPSPSAQPDETSKEKEEEQHVTTAVNVPAPVRQHSSHGHHHHRSTSASVSAINSSTSLTEMNRDRTMSPMRLASFEGERPASAVGTPVHEKDENDENGSRSPSSSSSSSDSEDENDDDEDEVEDEDEEAEVCIFSVQIYFRPSVSVKLTLLIFVAHPQNGSWSWGREDQPTQRRAMR